MVHYINVMPLGYLLYVFIVLAKTQQIHCNVLQTYTVYDDVTSCIGNTKPNTIQLSQCQK